MYKRRRLCGQVNLYGTLLLLAACQIVDSIYIAEQYHSRYFGQLTAVNGLQTHDTRDSTETINRNLSIFSSYFIFDIGKIEEVTIVYPSRSLRSINLCVNAIKKNGNAAKSQLILRKRNTSLPIELKSIIYTEVNNNPFTDSLCHFADI